MTLQDEKRLGRLWALDSVNLVPIADKDYFQETIDDSMTQLRALHEDATHVFWTLDSADIRVTFDPAHDPVAGTDGHLFAAGGSGVWPRALAEAARMIRNAGVDAVIRVSQLKRMNT
jgi:hypothetical protein